MPSPDSVHHHGRTDEVSCSHEVLAVWLHVVSGGMVSMPRRIKTVQLLLAALALHVPGDVVVAIVAIVVAIVVLLVADRAC